MLVRYDFPLEEEAIERKVQYERIKKMYDLKITTDGAETVKVCRPRQHGVCDESRQT